MFVGCIDGEYLVFVIVDGFVLEVVVVLVDLLCCDVVGDEVIFVVNCNINFINICYIGCWFCVFV